MCRPRRRHRAVPGGPVRGPARQPRLGRRAGAAGPPSTCSCPTWSATTAATLRCSIGSRLGCAVAQPRYRELHGQRPRAVRPRVGLLARAAGGDGDAGRGPGAADALGPSAGGGRGPPDRHVRQPALAAPGADPAPDLHGGVRDPGGGAGRLQAGRRRPPRHQVDPVTGLRYDARDPDLLLWVHCLVDSFLLFERLTVGRLDDAGRQAFHEESMLSAELLRLPRERIPPTVPALRAYLDEVMASGILRMTDGARRVADLFGDPPREVPAAPVGPDLVPGLPDPAAVPPPALPGPRRPGPPSPAAGQPARPPPRPPPGPAPHPLRRPRRHGRLAPGGPLRVLAEAAAPRPTGPTGESAVGVVQPRRRRQLNSCKAAVSARMTVCYRGQAAAPRSRSTGRPSRASAGPLGPCGPRLRRTLPVGRAGTCGRKGTTDGADH